jgi:hypothetical protein
MAKKQLIRLTEGDLHRIIEESVKRMLCEISEKERKRQMNDDWEEIESHNRRINRLHPKDSQFTQSSLGDSFASNWAGAGRTPGALAMDAQLPYKSLKGVSRVSDIDTSEWSEPSMKNSPYRGINAARNFARNIRYKADHVDGMTPYPLNMTGDPYSDDDFNNLDDQDYFDTKIKSTNGKWYNDKKEYYKRMKKNAQDALAKRNKTDDERSFRRALKAADSRPLHRKDSANRDLMGID